jgi:hypothetical protein
MGVCGQRHAPKISLLQIIKTNKFYNSNTCSALFLLCLFLRYGTVVSRFQQVLRMNQLTDFQTSKQLITVVLNINFFEIYASVYLWC